MDELKKQIIVEPVSSTIYKGQRDEEAVEWRCYGERMGYIS